MKENCVIRAHRPLTCFSLPEFPLWHGFFARTGGVSISPYASLNTAYATEDSQASANQDLLFRTLGIEHQPIRILNPCHGERIVFVEKSDWIEKDRDVLIKTDAAFTCMPNTYFLVSTADCIPAIFTDVSLSFTGVAHLGWRNVVAGLTGKIIARLQAHYDLSPASIRVAIGPSIYPCCYVFKEPVQKDDPFWQPFLRDRGGGNYAIDLVSAFKAQLMTCGIPGENILEAGLCTGCQNEVFFSCYREGYRSGRFPTVVGLRKI